MDTDTIAYFDSKLDKVTSQLNIDNDKIVDLQQEIVLLKQYIDYQNSKIEKVTSLIGNLLEKKSQDEAVLNTIQALQEDVDVGDLQRQVDQLTSHHSLGQSQQQQQHQLLNSQHRQQPPHQQHQQQHLHQHQNQHQQQHSQRPSHMSQDISSQLESNMDPALHQVAVATAAVQQAQAHSQSNEPLGMASSSQQRVSKPTKKQSRKKSDITGSKGETAGAKSSPVRKVHITFMHNPTNVREIYDEFFKGYKGQEPLCELDEKIKKISKRKKLCDAIQRGMVKYGKNADEIIEYLESFRKDKSLTWLMNGHLPEDLQS
ncbi:Transcriptional activator of glycolytic enzymes family protein [Candida albicans]|uniref:Transcriptional activator of glycolytic enzymes family protein n=1 Tax=Candida albicans TaxID=5476 RepID=A0A8H6F2X2_CANAX|nr:Transcriptional activator of glycolytic enzymes family protein [Candida albicans]